MVPLILKHFMTTAEAPSDWVIEKGLVDLWFAFVCSDPSISDVTFTTLLTECAARFGSETPMGESNALAQCLQALYENDMFDVDRLVAWAASADKSLSPGHKANLDDEEFQAFVDWLAEDE